MIVLLLLLQFQAIAATINCGSVGDTGFIGGTAYTILNPPVNVPTTLRFGPHFQYHIPAAQGVYSVKLTFVETSTSDVGQRSFIVKGGGVLMDVVDIYAEAGGQLKPLTKTYTLITSGFGTLDLDFIAMNLGVLCPTCRSNAMLSQIDYVQFAPQSIPTLTSFKASGLSNCRVDRVNDTRVVINGAATSADPCNVGRFPLNSIGTIDLPATSPPTETVLVYIAYDALPPYFEVAWSGILPTISANIHAVQASTYPAHGLYFPLAVCVATVPAVWDTTGCIDKRSIFALPSNIEGGSGIQIIRQPDGVTTQIQVDSSVARQ